MKNRICFLPILLLFSLSPKAQSLLEDVRVNDLRLTRSGDFLVVDMAVDLSDLEVGKNRAVLLSPCLKNGNDSIELPSIGVYGRKRYYHYVRNNEHMLSGEQEKSYRASKKPEGVVYHEIVPYREWMDAAVLKIHRSVFGCCNTILANADGIVGRYDAPVPFVPELIYIKPKVEAEKHRTIEGIAFIDFPVDRTVIYPDYRRNTTELGKIQATIDSVRNDRDVTITSVSLKGYASPESPYAHNKDLAKGRTKALKEYIEQLYRFDEGIITTDYEPEDWAGLRRYVAQSNIHRKEDLLTIIDSPLDPDKKEAKIKRNHPAEYRFLLQNCYPALRHTDYRIAYDIRTYSRPEEIKRIMQTRPQNLSLNEFYLVAKDLEAGTKEFSEVFETAVRMFPEDETANLNAASAALARRDFTAAAKYLARAGNLPEAIYTRGVYAYLTEDIVQAKQLFKAAGEKGVIPANEALQQLNQNK